MVKFEAYPMPIFSWYSPKNEQISSENQIYNTDKYNVSIKQTEIIFTIKHPELADLGNYTLEAKNDEIVEKLVIQFFVKGEIWEIFLGYTCDKLRKACDKLHFNITITS